MTQNKAIYFLFVPIKLDNITDNIVPKLTKLKKYSKIKNLNKIIKSL